MIKQIKAKHLRKGQTEVKRIYPINSNVVFRFLVPASMSQGHVTKRGPIFSLSLSVSPSLPYSLFCSHSTFLIQLRSHNRNSFEKKII